MTSSGLFSGYHGARVNTTVTTIILCEDKFKDQGQAVVPSCPPLSFVNLTYINYERTQHYLEVCYSRRGIADKERGPVTSVTEWAEALCQGQRTCRLTYTGLDLWDTCHNNYKYFEVRYSCIGQGKKNDTLAGYEDTTYHQISNIRPNKSQNLNVSRIVLQLSYRNPLKPDVKSRMKM